MTRLRPILYYASMAALLALFVLGGCTSAFSQATPPKAERPKAGASNIVPNVPSEAAPAPPASADPPKMVELTPRAALDDTAARRLVSHEQVLVLRSQIMQAKIESARELKLKLAPLEAALEAQSAQAPIGTEFSGIEKQLTAWIAATKKVNGWGDDVTYNRQTGKFEKPAPPEAKHP
jgi:hypothetical protein